MFPNLLIQVVERIMIKRGKSSAVVYSSADLSQTLPELDVFFHPQPPCPCFMDESVRCTAQQSSCIFPAKVVSPTVSTTIELAAMSQNLCN